MKKKKTKKTATGPSNAPRSPIVNRIREYHRERQELLDELEKNRPPIDDLFVDDFATFSPVFRSDSHDISYYKAIVEFRGTDVDLIVYPNFSNGKPPSRKRLSQHKKQFDSFCRQIDDALLGLPTKLGPICREYNLTAFGEMSFADLLGDLNWTNVKLGSTTEVASYVHFPKISRDFDFEIFFRFSRLRNKLSLVKVQIDG